MTNIPTAHNSAKAGDFAKTVLMPGDPLRAKYIAETYLENPRQVNAVRNMFGYTGTYKGKEISVMGGGMGMPSIGIYSYELFNFYDVDQVIRIGSAGAFQDNIKLMDVVIGMGACTDSNYAYQYGLPGTFAPIADYELLNRAVETAKRQGTNVVVGNVLSSDVFYNAMSNVNDLWRDMGVLAVEMEAAALYMNAAKAGKKALCMLTISDHLYTGESLSAEDPEFNRELTDLLNNYAGRPSRLYYAAHMTEDLGGAKVYLKREDLNHTGAHKINNVLGQVLLAKKMGKTRVIAETGAGQHGVATATAAALMSMECEVFMGKEDTERQALNVYRMRLLGAKVHAVTSGTATLKDAVSETMREWTNRISDTHYVLGSVMGPHPFPTIVRDFQAVISKEIKEQILEKEGKLPDAVLACVGGGSNAIGTFYNFIEDEGVRLIGCEAAGRGVNTAETAATIATGKLGIFHGMKSYFCQDEYGQIAPVYSISAGLDYPGVGPEHAHLYDIGRAEYVPVTDDEAVDAFEYLSRTEGIIPAIESAHAVAYARKIVPQMRKDQIVVITISGRGDKDCAAIARYRGEDIHE